MFEDIQEEAYVIVRVDYYPYHRDFEGLHGAYTGYNAEERADTECERLNAEHNREYPPHDGKTRNVYFVIGTEWGDE